MKNKQKLGLWQLQLKLGKLRKEANELAYSSIDMPYALYRSLISLETSVMTAQELTKLIRHLKKKEKD